MPKLSQRAIALPASPIRKLAPLAESAQARGIRIFHLNIGQPDIETPREFFDAIDAAGLKVVAYSPSPGITPLRTAITDYYDRLGYALSIDDVIVTTGASEALTFVFACIVNAGDEVIVPVPFYANYSSFSIGKDARIVPVQTSIEDNFDLPSIEEFESKITDRTKAILICNPGNPTGVVYCPETLARLKELANKHDLFLVADEVYREFVYGDATHQSILGFDDLDEHAIVIDSISKRFSACGARIGCVISRNRELMDSVMKMAQARLSPPTFGQIGAAAVYQLPATYYEGMIAEFARRRDALKAALDAIPGVVCPEINGAFYAMVRLPVDDAEKFCEWMLESFEHNGATVMMAPGEGFYATPGAGRDEVRIAYVLNTDDLSAAVECLAAGLQAYPGNTLQSSSATAAS